MRHLSVSSTWLFISHCILSNWKLKRTCFEWGREQEKWHSDDGVNSWKGFPHGIAYATSCGTPSNKTLSSRSQFSLLVHTRVLWVGKFLSCLQRSSPLLSHGGYWNKIICSLSIPGLASPLPLLLSSASTWALLLLVRISSFRPDGILVAAQGGAAWPHHPVLLEWAGLTPH